MLFAGVSAANTLALGGALSFHVDYPPSAAWWFAGSANKFSLLVRVLAALLPIVVLFRLIWTIFRRLRTGPTVPLIFF